MPTTFDLILWLSGFLAGVGAALLLVRCLLLRLRCDYFLHHRIDIAHRTIEPPDPGESWKDGRQ